MENVLVINPLGVTAKLTTTLNRLRAAGACSSGYAKLLAGLGGVGYDHDAPINLLTVLQTNGANDCLWALCATEQNCDKIARLIAADLAESVLHIYEGQYPKDSRPRAAIEAARTLATANDDAARAAASDAAWAAARVIQAYLLP